MINRLMIGMFVTFWGVSILSCEVAAQSSGQSLLGVRPDEFRSGSGTGTGTGRTRELGDEHWSMHQGWKDVRYPATLSIGIGVFVSSSFVQSGWQTRIPGVNPADSLDAGVRATL